MDLKECAKVLKKYDDNERKINSLRDKISTMEDQIYDSKDIDDNISKIKNQCQDEISKVEEDYLDVYKYLNSVHNPNNATKGFVPKNTHKNYDEYFINTFENLNKYAKIQLWTLFVSIIAIVALWIVLAITAQIEWIKYVVIPFGIAIPVLLFFILRTSIYKPLQRYAYDQGEALKDKHNIFVKMKKDEIVEKIERLQFSKTQEIDRRKALFEEEEKGIEEEIKKLRQNNFKKDIPEQIFNMYKEVENKELFVYFLEFSETESILTIYQNVRVQEMLKKLNDNIEKENIRLQSIIKILEKTS